MTINDCEANDYHKELGEDAPDGGNVPLVSTLEGNEFFDPGDVHMQEVIGDFENVGGDGEKTGQENGEGAGKVGEKTGGDVGAEDEGKTSIDNDYSEGLGGDFAC